MTGVTEATGAVPAGLLAHWAGWLGVQPDRLGDLGRPPAGGSAGSPPVVVGSARREEPDWDGAVHPVAGVVDPYGRAVVAVPPQHAAWAAGLVADGADLARLRAELPGRLGLPGHLVYQAVYRWTVDPTPASALPDAGAWLPATDPRVPAWLRPFGGQALVELDGSGDGRYLAGVGLKRHDEHVHELAVGTAEEARGRGLARRLVARAARELLARGVVPTYLHDPRNVASARVALAAGLPDLGWGALGLTEEPVADRLP